MTEQTSLKALAQRVLSRSKAGQCLGHQRDSEPGQVSQALNRVGHLNSAENRHFGQVSRCPCPIGVGQWDTPHPKRDSAWDTSGTAGVYGSGYDAESGLPMGWIEGYRRLAVMRRPRAIPATTWTWLTAAAGQILTRWGTQLAGHGWSTIEIFGVHFEAAQSRASDAGLLAHLVDHKKLEAIGPRSAALRLPDGTALRLNRPLATAAGVVLAWELTTGHPTHCPIFPTEGALR
jgi:hypothetical protein